MTYRELDTNVPDWLWMAGFLGVIFISVWIVQEYIPAPYSQAIKQVYLAGLAAMIAILSYRFAVKSNVRSAIDELEPLIIEGHRINPTLYDVKWRPHFLKRLEFLPVIPSTTIQFNLVVEGEDTIRLGDMESYLTECGISEQDFNCKANEIYPISDESAVTIDHMAPPHLDEEGLRFLCFSTNGREVRRFTDRVLRRLADELE